MAAPPGSDDERLAFDEDGWGRMDLPYEDEPLRRSGNILVQEVDVEYLITICVIATVQGIDRRLVPGWLAPKIREPMPYDIWLDALSAAELTP